VKHFSSTPLKNRLLVLPANIKLGQKRLLATNTLAYCKHTLIITVTVAEPKLSISNVNLKVPNILKPLNATNRVFRSVRSIKPCPICHHFMGTYLPALHPAPAPIAMGFKRLPKLPAFDEYGHTD
jgi:hypothetical protein